MITCQISGCNSPARTRGWCPKHYTRWRRGQAVTDEERLLVRFSCRHTPEPNSGCWLWTENVNNHGYGVIKISGKNKKAHRVSWELFRTPIPDGECVLHKCDVRCCVNPDHLYIGNRKQNADDMMRRGRKKILKGSDCGSSKLTEEQVLSIRADPRLQREIAAHYGLERSTIGKIKTRKNWGHIP